MPHVLAALTLNNLECRAPSTHNIRTVLSPQQIKKIAEERGLKLVNERKITPKADLLDAKWEVSYVLRPKFEQQIETSSGSLKEHFADFAVRDSLESAVAQLQDGLNSVRCMDVWVGTFEAKTYMNI
eukprot:TRINITY_DN4136_c0_g1_i1.p1 TRINITY_DN4136_c0_g1~~TRINITY_DN4136_c0_g1_i1.p1  ORF type:complete len:127 (+),score=23.56 TRINITY_DN4136_c0_g1_i1:548-928(+)